MRINRLDLLRYGKFTDRCVTLPSAAQDFHLIVGPNEAGKSTLRNAIQDLLFGIETRSRYNFLHPHKEMRLGALIEQGASQLDFIRTKAQSKTLQTSASVPLPDQALTPFLGPVDRVFFDQMFGLNHARLVSGGKQILSASDNIGQILFQAAAGIGSLGDVRDRLEQEADKLWAKRKSGEREYYLACTELEQAESALKHATVRTKDWQEARTQMDRISADLGQAREHYQVLAQEQMQLERLRRVAPLLSTLIEAERQQADLGGVVLLPDQAADQLAHAEHEVAIASQTHLLFEKQATELQTALAALHPVEAILARGPDIEALSAMRQQLRNHESDINKRETEIRVLWQTVAQSTRQLGWPQDSEDAVAQRLPDSLIRASLDNMVRRHEGLNQALVTAQQLLSSRQEEVKTLDAEMTELPAAVIPVALADALATARAMGDVASQERRVGLQLSRLQRELVATTLELGTWNPGPDLLRQLLPPTQDETQMLIKQRSDLTLVAVTVGERLNEVQADIERLRLEIAQYKTTHDPVTLGDVHQVRRARDATWLTIKSGSTALMQAAPDYEQAVAQADLLSDKRHDKAQQETELQSRLDRLQRLQQQSAELALRVQDHAQTLADLDQTWARRIQTLGLAGLPLLQVNNWRAARERVLGAAEILIEAQLSQADFLASVAQARGALTQALQVETPEVQSYAFSALILLADERVTTATRAQERRKALGTQKIRAEAALPDLNQRVLQAQTALTTWQADLQKNLRLAHLPPDSTMGTIEGALALFESMSQRLQKMREIRATRIDMMRRDLKEFADAALILAQDLAPLLCQEAPAQIALQLDSQLRQELLVSQALGRLKTDVAKVSAQAQAASLRITQAKASLAPLMHVSGVTDNEGLRVAIDRSDRLRVLHLKIEQAQRQLLQAGDGLARDALETAFEATDGDTISNRLPEIKRQLDDVVAQQNRLSGELTSAEAALGKIAGQAQAAKAESQRQEALARMGNAVERYLKVYTAAKLLRWSIERFRESKQGPMLARASEVFKGLTQGVFNQLVVDFESDPLKLSGQRISGELVDIDGMSEGTRDQLYLALRLAALELHLAQTVPLPFIADDLFINYDDGRARAGLSALARLSEKTQVIFLSHHAHLVPLAQSVLGDKLNVIYLD